MSSESVRFSFRQECEVSMWLLADGPVPLSDGVCAFPRALFSIINFLHGNQAKTFVFYAEFQGLSDAINCFLSCRVGHRVFSPPNVHFPLLSYICARTFSKN